MATFSNRTRKAKGEYQDPDGKPRVYFTCHCDDYAKYCNAVCSDIIEAADCAVFYTDDMSAEISEAEAKDSLGTMNLFVVPVTEKLLSTENRAMNADIKFAKKHGIRILPIMAESGLDKKYDEKFGKRQYVTYRGIGGFSEEAYKGKLKKALEAVLLDPEDIKKIRAAFDAYIFLSYRKKDGKYVNELRRLIHSVPECRDIAIWYDDYIIGGESFTESIERAMKKSRIFALLVTPSVLERHDGKPNYVMHPEYHDAHEAKMEIFPVEMQDTDKAELEKEFRDLPQCTRGDCTDTFRERLLESVRRAAITRSPDNPEHDLFIGLAYLDGIDVERNTELAAKLLASAADAGIGLAMKRLADYYIDCEDVRCVEWAEKLVAHCTQKYGEASDEAIGALYKLARAKMTASDRDGVIELDEKCYKLRRASLGDKHEKTIEALCELIENESWLRAPSDHSGVLKELLAEDRSLITPRVLYFLEGVIGTTGDAGDYGTALFWSKYIHEYMLEKHGEGSKEEIAAHERVAHYRGECGNLEKTLVEKEALHIKKARAFGANSREALSAKLDIADAYMNAVYPNDETNNAARVIAGEVCDACEELFGKEDDLYISSLHLLARANARTERYEAAQKQLEEIYTRHRRLADEPNSYTAALLDEIARVCMHTDKEAARDYLIERCRLLDTLEYEDFNEFLENRCLLAVSLKMLAGVFRELKNYPAALECLRYYVPLAEEHLWDEPEQAEKARAEIRELKKIIG